VGNCLISTLAHCHDQDQPCVYVSSGRWRPRGKRRLIIRPRDDAAAEQRMRDLEDTLAVIEKFIRAAF
jgi:hypothetical protein